MTDKQKFVAEIFATPCERCPIAYYCKSTPSVTCKQSARLYYERMTEKYGRVYTLPELLSETQL